MARPKTDDQFERVFSTKVQGLRALLAATENDQLRTVALLSSIAATVGNAGQADYAMANEVLNAVAAVEASRRGDGCRVVAFGYGPWQGGMVSPALQKHFLEQGVGLIPLDAGAEATVDVLLARAPIPPRLVLAVGASMGGDERAISADVIVDPREPRSSTITACRARRSCRSRWQSSGSHGAAVLHRPRKGRRGACATFTSIAV